MVGTSNLGSWNDHWNDDPSLLPGLVNIQKAIENMAHWFIVDFPIENGDVP